LWPASRLSRARHAAHSCDRWCDGGCHLSYSTLVAPYLEYNEFREALLQAEISDRNDGGRASYAVPYLAPVRMHRGKDE